MRFNYKQVDFSSCQLSTEESFTVIGLVVYPLEGQNEQNRREANCRSMRLKLLVPSNNCYLTGIAFAKFRLHNILFFMMLAIE